MDRISRLPDEVLCHILSFLPTEEAIATNLISKRWRHLWTSVPALDLNQHQFCLRTGKPHTSFEEFVNTAMLARDVRQPIRSFRLDYETFDYDGPPAVNDWVNTVMQRGIENLDIVFDEEPDSIDLSIFSCRTLVVLKLTGLYVSLSSPVELPSLKSLRLEIVGFQEPQSFLELINGCPFLEDLRAHCVLYHYNGPLKEEFESLPKLVRVDICDIEFDFPLKMISNAEFLSIEEYTYTGFDEVVIPKFSNLVHVVFTFLSCMKWQFVFEILKNCPKLQVFELLLLGHHGQLTLLPYPDLVPECLTSQFRNCFLKNYKATIDERLFVKYILQNSTSLRTMRIRSENSSSTRAKHEMLKELSMCPRRSALCELSFDNW